MLMISQGMPTPSSPRNTKIANSWLPHLHFGLGPSKDLEEPMPTFACGLQMVITVVVISQSVALAALVPCVVTGSKMLKNRKKTTGAGLHTFVL